MKIPFSIIGKTPEGNLVVSGCWLARDQFGIPFDTTFDALKNANAFPDWKEILAGAKKQGVNKSKFLTELETETVAAFGKDCWVKVEGYFTEGLQ
mgnify:CR=1 FL=1